VVESVKAPLEPRSLTELRVDSGDVFSIHETENFFRGDFCRCSWRP